MLLHLLNLLILHYLSRRFALFKYTFILKDKLSDLRVLLVPQKWKQALNRLITNKWFSIVWILLIHMHLMAFYETNVTIGFKNLLLFYFRWDI